jgi:hypothetical protein
MLLHKGNGDLYWGEDFYFGTTLHASFAIGASFTLQASTGIALSIKHNQSRFLFAVNFANLFGSKEELFTTLESNL